MIELSTTWVKRAVEYVVVLLVPAAAATSHSATRLDAVYTSRE